MEGTLAEIRGFAGSFAPEDWAYCSGQTIKISDNPSLFSLLGTYYGGDGVNTFCLPDLRGRVFIHQGTGPGLYPRYLGERGGYEKIRLTVAQIPRHDHAAATQGGSGSLSGNATAKMFVNNGTGDQSIPNNNFLGFESNEGGFYASSKDANSALNGGAISVDTSGLSVNVSGINVAIGETGGNDYHSNMQPYLTMSWIICVRGMYPMRP